MSRPILAMVLPLVLVGCATAGSSGTTSSATASSTTASALSLAPPTLAPTATPDPPEPSLAEPPAASLAAEGGDPVAGSLGSFTWGGGGSDSPWLPGAAIKVASGEPLTLTLADDVPVDGWVAKRVTAGTTDGVGAIAMGKGTATPIAFVAPGPGTWSVQVVVTFGDDAGSAAYYWEVDVT